MTATESTRHVLTDSEREELLESVRKLATDKIAPRALELANTHEYPHDVFQLLADSGYFGLYLDPKWGGMGFDLWTVCRVIEELAYASNTAASIVVGQLQGSLPILITSREDVRDRLMPQLVSGEIKLAMAITEPDAGSDVANISTRITRDGDHYVVTGRKCFITNAPLADFITVWAKATPGRSTSTIQGILVPANTPGYEITRVEEKMAAGALPTCEVVFDDCRVPEKYLMGAPGEGFRNAMQVLERVRPLIAARSVGLARGTLDAAIEHMKVRQTFGKPLAGHQGLQFMVADMATGIEAASSLVERACNAIDRGDPKANRYCAMAKLFATDMAMKVTVDAVQLFGGYGVMKDYPVEHRLREAKIGQIVDGTSEIQKIVIARSLFGRLPD